ncbi:hypothetical protein FRB97_006660 [Tulasnella sp. 331]|nr:hypothetical protein FRB97_006660 [Tulasnella sp. 331]
MLQKIRVELAHIQLWEDPIVDSITFTALQELSIESSQPGPLEQLLLNSIMPALRSITVKPRNGIVDRPNDQICGLLRRQTREMFLIPIELLQNETGMPFRVDVTSKMAMGTPEDRAEVAADLKGA